MAVALATTAARKAMGRIIQLSASNATGFENTFTKSISQISRIVIIQRGLIFIRFF